MSSRREKIQSRYPGDERMIKSMTGFASLTSDGEDSTLTVTIKAVNHRFLDLQLRLPSSVAGFEARLRTRVRQRLARGRVEVTVTEQRRDHTTPTVQLNEPFVAALEQALDRARVAGLVVGHLTPGDLIRLPQALTVQEQVAEPRDGDLERLEAEVTGVVERGVAELDTMRIDEGAHLAQDLESRVQTVAAAVTQVAEAASEGEATLSARLTERVREVAAEVQADPTAVAQEIVKLAARSDISEEVTRFRGHLAHWRALVTGDEPCGRKLDFLLQEMNREINTIGSKADGATVPAVIIEIKAELERMREQVQNVE